MKSIPRYTILTAIAVLSCSPIAASDSKVTIAKADGGPISTTLSPGIVVNDGSTLQREWITINHMLLPAKLVGCPGVTTVYVEGGRFSSSGYQYRTKFDVAVTEPLTAIEFRFLTFDLWGERGKSLVMTKIQDFPPGETNLRGEWQIYSENEASGFYASIAYVSRVRTKEGKIITADIRPVVEEAKKLYAKFSESDLDPEKPTKTGK